MDSRPDRSGQDDKGLRLLPPCSGGRREARWPRPLGSKKWRFSTSANSTEDSECFLSPDQGFAGSPWLGACFQRQLRFILLWLKGYHLPDDDWNTRPPGHERRQKALLWERQVLDGRRQWFQAGAFAIPGILPDYEQPLWLVVSCPGKGRPPWYLFSTEEISGEDDAWKVVFAYVRAWASRDDVAFQQK